jgi:hypothetical protein
MVIIDDHGGGWRGACEDDQNGSGNLMSMVDMAAAMRGALSDAGVSKFNVVTFHACLMSMVEVAYELRTCADYLVASEFSMPMESVLGADIWLTDLVATPSKPPSQVASEIATAVKQAGIQKQKTVHMAATNLAVMNRLAAKVDNFATQIHTSAGDHWLEVLQAWLDTHVSDQDDQANVDLWEFANNILLHSNLHDINLIHYACDSLMAAINDAVIMNEINGTTQPRSGLTIYMPYLSEMYDQSGYGRLAFAAVGWNEFVEDFIATIEALTSYTLTVTCNPTNGGSCAIDPDQDTYPAGDTVSILAIPATDWTFAGWSGDISETANPIGIIMNSDAAIVANFTQQQQQTTISGTVTWPGHTLSNYTVALADTNNGTTVYLVAQAAVNPANGAYTITLNNTTTWHMFFEGWDDVDNNAYDPGDGWGFFDYNNDGEWMLDDMVNVAPGAQLTGVNIVLGTVTAGKRDHPGLSQR